MTGSSKNHLWRPCWCRFNSGATLTCILQSTGPARGIFPVASNSKSQRVEARRRRERGHGAKPLIQRMARRGRSYSSYVLPVKRLRLLWFAATAPGACSSRAAVHSLNVGNRKLETALLCRKARIIVRNTGTGLGVVFRKRDLSWGNSAVLIITVTLNEPSPGTSRSSPSTAGRCRTWCCGPVRRPK